MSSLSQALIPKAVNALSGGSGAFLEGLSFEDSQNVIS